MSYKRCADAIMRNNPLDSTSESSTTEIMVGGVEKTESKPNGGFPPIIMCKSKPKVVDEKIKSVKGKNVVSLQDIMEKRRDFSPFLPDSK